MLGALIGAGASLLGGLLGGESSQRTKEKTKAKTKSSSSTTTRSHLGQMVRAAEKNGFNPLTVLQSGGLSAYSTSQNTGFSVTKSKSKGKGASSSSAPFGQAIAGVGQAIGSAVGAAEQGSTQAATARDAWAGLRSPTPYGDPYVSRGAQYDLALQQLGGGGANMVTQGGGNPQVPSSSVATQTVPMLSLSTDPNKVTPSTFNNPLSFLDQYSPGGVPQGVGWSDPKVEQNEVMNFQPKVLTDRGYRIPTWVAPASAIEEWFGENETIQGIAGMINAGAYVYHNRDLVKRDAALVGQSVADQAKAEFNKAMEDPLLSYRKLDDNGNVVSTTELFPSPNYIAVETQKALKRISPDPALAASAGAATRARQYMELNTGVTW